MTSLLSRRTTLILPLAAATVTGTGSAWADDATAEVVRLVNTFRGSNRLATLAPHPQLTAAAQGHADDMARTGVFSHTGRSGSTMVSRITVAGYNYGRAAENIAYGQSTPRAAVQSWIDSAGHRANMLLTDIVHIGAGHASRNDSYWVLVLAGPLR